MKKMLGVFMKGAKGLGRFAFKSLKFLGPKGVLAVIIIGALLLFMGVGLGTGLGFGDNEGDGNTKVEAHSEVTELEENSEAAEFTAKTDSSDDESLKIKTEAVSVVENGYFYKNEPISLDEFINEIQSIEEEIIIEVTDTDASLRAYDRLIDKLEECHYEYSEK